MKPLEKAKAVPFSFGGMQYGMASGSPHTIPSGYGELIEEFRHVITGMKTRLPWITIDKGFASGSYPSAASGGWNYATLGLQVGYSNSDSGKLALFEGGGYVDSDTTATFITASMKALSGKTAGDTAAYRGVVWFADAFLVYTADYLYSVNITSGVLTQQIRFSTQLGAGYYPILKMIPRYGQLWAITEKDIIFWSTVGEYTIGSGSPETVPLANVWDKWQMLVSGPIASVASVEQLLYDESIITIPVGLNAITKGTNYVHVQGTTSLFSVGDLVRSKSGSTIYETLQVATGGVNQLNVKLYQATTLATRPNIVYIKVHSEGETNSAGLFGAMPGDSITITQAGRLTTNSAIRGAIRSGTYVVITLESPLAADYTTDATFTNNSRVTLKLTTNWAITVPRASIVRDVWTALTLNTDYEVSLDPDEDVDADGHVKLLGNNTVKSAVSIRCTFTPYENDWKRGSANWLSINPSIGDTCAVAEGPNAKEVEGSSLLYIFKDNGDIYALIGKPGVHGNTGNLDIRYVGTSITARQHSIRTLPGGVVFGGFDGIDYQVRFIPHFKFDVNEIPILTTRFSFDSAIPFSDETYTFREVTGLLHGDLYAISFLYTKAGVTQNNGKIYLCKVYSSDTGIIGSWVQTKDNTEAEHESNTSDSVVSAPMTMFMYRHGRHTYRSYIVKTGHDYAGNTRYYEIARYGQHTGTEECRDRLIMTRQIAGPAYQTFVATDYYWAIIKTGMTKIGSMVNKIVFDVDCVGGQDANGIDFTMQIYKDLQSTGELTANYTRNDLTDVTGDEKLLVDRKLKIDARYVQFYLKWDNIRYYNKPAYVLFRNAVLELEPMEERLLSEEDWG